jgi:hypothetical protein
MKVIYEANDGTKFESEVDCKNYENTKSFYDKSKKIEELLDIADRECDGYFYTLRNIADFIIENISEINEALGVQESKYTFTGKYGEVYEAVDDPDTSCNHCSFKAVKFIEGGNCCNAKEEFDCYENKIIWIKK